MAVDYFLIEGPRAVPQEFAAWEAARKEHSDYFFQNCGPDPEPPPDFDERGQALGRKAAALEETARAAFLLWLMRPKHGWCGECGTYRAMCDCGPHGVPAGVNADLLAACKAAAGWLEGWASAEPYLSQLRAAIARADGVGGNDGR